MGHGDFFFEKRVAEYFGLRNADLGSTHYQPMMTEYTIEKEKKIHCKNSRKFLYKFD